MSDSLVGSEMCIRDRRSMTQGRGSFVSKFERYDEAPVPVQEKVIAENKARLEALNKE